MNLKEEKNLVDVILNLKTIRRYKPLPISSETLKTILEAARLAPTANNAQPWHFIVVTDQEVKEELSKGKWNRFIKDSAVTIIGVGDPSVSPKWHMIDVAIALQNMVLAAAALGIGSCWIGDFDEQNVKKLFGIPDNLKVVALLSLGYPATGSQRQKKHIDEIVHYEKF